ncbi:hypothetical protein F4779DRAFT_633878 [Xylariaceae sp. FL0662B]|nr:hypothetical protein F4779DRAFT_633878 [Xylariaceae sp. FL0662B]
MANETKLSLIELLPTELIYTIFTVAADANDVHSLMLASKRLYSVYERSSGLIAKSHSLRILSPSDYKLAIMAVESRAVDPTDQASLSEFFEVFIYQKDWIFSQFRMSTVSQLPSLLEAAVHFLPGANNINNLSTPTEHARIVRTILMWETAINLFHWMPGKDGEMLWRAPHPSWVDKYLDSFSNGELYQDMDLAMDISMANVLMDRNLIGVEKLSKWCRELREWPRSEATKERPIRPSRLHSEYIRFVAASKDHPALVEEQMIHRCVERSQQKQRNDRPRFHPDPDTMNDITWKWSQRKWANFFYDDQAFKHPSLRNGRSLFDKGKLEAWRQHIYEHRMVHGVGP